MFILIFSISCFMCATQEVNSYVASNAFTIEKIEKGQTKWLEFSVIPHYEYELYLIDYYNDPVFRLMNRRKAVNSVWFQIYKENQETKYPAHVYKNDSDSGGVTREDSYEPVAVFRARGEVVKVKIEGYEKDDTGYFAYALIERADDSDYDPDYIYNRIPAGNFLIGNDENIETEVTSGVALMGGDSEDDNVMKWMAQNSGGGDFVVIRERGGDAYNSYIYETIGGVDSVLTLVIDSRDSAENEDVVGLVRDAEALFFAGGNQGDYVKYYKDSKLEDAINYLINEKGITIGGTSAGCAIMGEFYFSAMNGTITSEQALKDPYHEKATVGKDFISNNLLKNMIMDTHFDDPPRNGRLVSFMARIVTEGWVTQPEELIGIGIEGSVGFTFDTDGNLRVYNKYSDNYVYFYKPKTSPDVCEHGEALDWDGDAVEVYQVKGLVGGDNVFNIYNWEMVEGEAENHYHLGVNGGRMNDPHPPRY